MARVPEVVYEVESVKLQSRPHISQRLGVNKKRVCAQIPDGKTVSPMAAGAVD